MLMQLNVSEVIFYFPDLQELSGVVEGQAVTGECNGRRL